jgi:hypothetical protein
MAGGMILCLFLSLFQGKRFAAMASIVGATIAGIGFHPEKTFT